MMPQPHSQMRPEGHPAPKAASPAAWDRRRRPAWSVLLWAIAGGGAVLAFLWCLIVLPNWTMDAFPTGDGAVIEIYTLHAARGLMGQGDLLGVGPYSRFGWHHPGPLFFYAVAPFYIASHFHHLAINAGALTINAIALATIGWCLTRYASATLGVTVSLALASYLWRLPSLLVAGWNPHIVLLPLAALIVASAVVATGRLALLPIAIASASFVAQTHIALAPSAILATMCAVAAGLYQQHRTRRLRATTWRASWLWAGLSALVGVILWLPALVEQFTADDGNLSKLGRFFLTDAHTGGVPPSEALTIWTMMSSMAVRPNVELPTGHGLPSAAGASSVTLAIASVLLLPVAGWWCARRDRRVDAWCCWLSALLSVAAFVAIVRIRGGIADHLVAWVTVIALMGLASLAAAGASMIAAWSAAAFARRPSRSLGAASGSAGHAAVPAPSSALPLDIATPAAGGPPSRAAAAGAWPAALALLASLALLIGALASGMRQLERQRADIAVAAAEPRTPAQAVYGAARAFLASAKIQRPLIRPAGAWGEAAAVILPLYKRGMPVAVPDDLLWLYGPQLAPHGNEDAELTVANRVSRPQVSQRADDCLLIERHGLSLHLLRSSLKTPAAVTCE